MPSLKLRVTVFVSEDDAAGILEHAMWVGCSLHDGSSYREIFREVRERIEAHGPTYYQHRSLRRLDSPHVDLARQLARRLFAGNTALEVAKGGQPA